MRYRQRETVSDSKWFKFKSRGLLGRIVTRRYLVHAQLTYTSQRDYEKPALVLIRDPDGKINCEINIREGESIRIHNLRVWRQFGPWRGEIPEETGEQS